MTVVELFAGAGGASLGLVAAGFEEVRAVEWDANACATRRAAGLRCDEGDVRDPKHYEGVTADAVWSSFPCQAWSTAGKRLGKDDPRNGWPWTVDVLDTVRPTWFMGENVPGLTFHKGACERGRCAEDCARLYFEGTILRELGERFASVQWRILDAARYGVPQNRERLILVAGPRPIRWPKETHAPPEELRAVGLFGDGRKPWVTVRQALGLGGTMESGSKCRRDADGVPRGPLVVGTDRPSLTIDSRAVDVRAEGRGAIPQSRRPMRLDTPSDTIQASGEGPRPPCIPVDASSPMWLRTEMTGASASPDTRPSPTVNGKGNTYVHPRDPGTRAASRPELLDKPSPTVTTCEVKGTRGEGQHGGPDRASDAAWLDAGIRRLTPAECATLQDFPPDHSWQGTKTSIYVQIGNSVPRTLAMVVAEAVRSA